MVMKQCTICGDIVVDNSDTAMKQASFCCGRGMKLIKKPHKTKLASKTLQLMDQDYSYGDAVRKILKENKNLTRKKLERDLNPFI